MDAQEAWKKYIIGPKWNIWAAGQFNEDRIKGEINSPIVDIESLEKTYDIIVKSNIDEVIVKAYQKSTFLLPPPEPGIKVAIILDTRIGPEVHGVVGGCVGDNIMLKVNPLIEGWIKYIPWVIAHEYHHTIWGYNYFFIKGNRSMKLLTALLNEGQADSFAKTVTDVELPCWLSALSLSQEKEQWETLQNYIFLEHTPDLHFRFFFGDLESDTPRYTGYSIGYRIVHQYLLNNPSLSFKDLLDKEDEEIVIGSKINKMFVE